MVFTRRAKKSVVRQGLIVVGALALILAGNRGSAWSATNCYDNLVNEAYRCKYKYEPGTEYTDTCAYFHPSMLGNQKMILVWTTVNYECTCTAKGSYSSPQFNQDKEFLCSSISPGYDDAFTGKVVGGGNKIKGQYYSDSNNASAVVECVNDPAFCQ